MHTIIHVDMDTFFVSVERLHNPSLIGKPVVVGGDPHKRGVVSAASYEVRKYGVHSGMPLSEAKRRCPHAVFVKAGSSNYSSYSRKVMAILKCYSPRVEVVSIDEAYLDFTGCERLLGPVLKAASVIKNEIFEKLQLPASLGIGSNKLIAKISSANYAKPNGIFFVPQGSEKDFLKALPIGKLPGVGEKTLGRLKGLGVFTIGDLAQFEKDLIVEIFGKYGSYLHSSANGIHEGDVVVEYEAKSTGRERTFQSDSLDIGFLSGELFKLAEKVGKDLRKDKTLAKTITLKLRYSDFKTVTRSQTLPEPTDRDHIIYHIARTHMLKLLKRRVRVRLLGVQASKLVNKNYQLSLLNGGKSEKYKAYYEAVDGIRKKYGFKSVFKDLGEE